MTCECEVCKYGRKYHAWLKTLSEEAKPFAEEMASNLMHSEADRSYRGAIIDGSWPDADRLIKEWRERVNGCPGPTVTM